MKDVHSIIVWKESPELKSIVENTFNVVHKQEFNVVGEDRKRLVKDIYHEVRVDDNDIRIKSTETITVYFVSIDINYKYFFRTEGYRLCNTIILGFKHKVRTQFDYTYFHCSDNPAEVNDVARCFKINNIKSPLKIIKNTELYHFIHNGDTHEDTYINKKFDIVPLKQSPVVKYMIGYKEGYLSQNNIFKKREETITWLQQQNTDVLNDHYVIPVVPFKNKWVALDGMHRSSLLYYRGYNDLVVKEEDMNDSTAFYNYLSDDKIVSSEAQSHLDVFNNIIFELNNQNIRYVVIRGFLKLPYTCDTDLDLVVHDQDWVKFQHILESNSNIKLNVNKKYNNKKSLIYKSYQTLGSLGDNLTNNSYQLDCYNYAFFFKNQNDGAVLSNSFHKRLFDNRMNYLNIFVPDNYSEVILLVGRTMNDLGGHWKEKHLNRAKELMKNSFDRNTFIKLLQEAFSVDLRHINVRKIGI